MPAALAELHPVLIAAVFFAAGAGIGTAVNLWGIRLVGAERDDFDPAHEPQSSPPRATPLSGRMRPANPE